MPRVVPPVADERTALTAYLAHQRRALRVTAYGLTEEQARTASTGSELSIGGLIKHATRCEEFWTDLILQQQHGTRRKTEESDTDEFRLAPDETLAAVLAAYAEAADRTDAVITGIPDLGQAVPVPQGAPWIPAEVKEWSIRWVLLHLIEETARHGGHADVIRESIDGATFDPLLAAAEAWPDPWVRPWEPATPTAG
ncbi:DinB family protein [Kitasatospora sp. DSM 101779]|uniref:DinB family protein n=1 Tax=Kitasatospora sp. DSM 101779 TaxID=2853165 RepID=UPI0021D7E0E7|nr:DinB family protein [Kitasatospora sp. DSM 101779]MCU7826081.1 DinB family protein [Kitasatospora sp. DSM 101779]